jgi:hypothetical protein
MKRPCLERLSPAQCKLRKVVRTAWQNPSKSLDASLCALILVSKSRAAFVSMVVRAMDELSLSNTILCLKCTIFYFLQRVSTTSALTSHHSFLCA